MKKIKIYASNSDEAIEMQQKIVKILGFSFDIPLFVENPKYNNYTIFEEEATISLPHETLTIILHIEGFTEELENTAYRYI